MKGAEFYEGGRIQVYIWEKERERRRWKRESRKVWVEFGGGGARKGGAKYEKGQNEKKRGPTRLNRPTLEKLAATCQPPPWPYVPYFSPLFNPGTIFQPGLERKRKGKEESRFCFFDRGRRWKFFYFNWSKNFAFKSWRIMETFIFLREIFFFQKKLQYFKFDSAT